MVNIEVKARDLNSLTWLEHPLSPLITRHAISRLAAQLYDRSSRLLGPVITTMKVLLSRSCEIMSYDELDLPIQNKDKEFVDLIVRVLESCKKWKTIKCVCEWRIASFWRECILHIYTQNHQTKRKQDW